MLRIKVKTTPRSFAAYVLMVALVAAIAIGPTAEAGVGKGLRWLGKKTVTHGVVPAGKAVWKFVW